MPLLDHFHGPLHPKRHWESFHSAWASSLADALNEQLLPENYFAEELTHAGPSVEIDVATVEDLAAPPPAAGDGVATVSRPQVWVPPSPPLIMPATFPDHFEVLVFKSEGGTRLVAAIELVSPVNKDRAERRRTFAVKCASYLVQGIGLIVVDVVTSRRANLHNEILRVLEKEEGLFLPAEVDLYAVAYRPLRREDRDEIEFWPFSLGVGQPLPVLPLALHAELVLPVDFEAAYIDTCQRRRLP
ncbi:MAG: DUF4058 family protein [Planctomycetes bacterium]|nr:DUF4058 family protein [Planctomycetota bacterium]